MPLVKTAARHQIGLSVAQARPKKFAINDLGIIRFFRQKFPLRLFGISKSGLPEAIKCRRCCAENPAGGGGAVSGWMRVLSRYIDDSAVRQRVQFRSRLYGPHSQELPWCPLKPHGAVQPMDWPATHDWTLRAIGR